MQKCSHELAINTPLKKTKFIIKYDINSNFKINSRSAESGNVATMELHSLENVLHASIS